jgi:hypothetical protein
LILKRAEPQIEKRALKIASQYMSNVSNFRVYLMLNPDGTHKINKNGQVAMKIFSDQEILDSISSGQVFTLPDGIE